MADSLNNDLWPVSKFYFLVSFSGGSVEGDISFQEVSGLDQETDVIEYRHGDNPEFSTIKKPGMTKSTNVVLKKGIFQNDARLTDMFNAIYDKKYYKDPADRMTVLIKLMDEAGEVIMNWRLDNAFPAKLTGTDLKSDASEIAVESLELAHQGITVGMGG